MVRGLMFALFVWLIVSLGIFVFGHLSSGDKLTVIKCALYGFITAIISSVFIGMTVVFF